MNWSHRLGISFAIFHSLVLSQATVHAQSADTRTPVRSEGALAARRALVERAQSAARLGRHAEAITLAEEAAVIETSPSLRMFLAQELGAMGRHANAMEQAESCVRELNRDLTMPRRETMLTECRRILSASQQLVVLVSVRVPAHPRPGIVLRVGSRTVIESEYGLPIPIDAGTLSVTAQAPGIEPHESIVQGIAGGMVRVEIPQRFSTDSQPNTPPALPETTGSSSTTNTTQTLTTGPQNTTASTTTTTGNAPNGSTALSQVTDPHPTPAPQGFFQRVGVGPFVTMGVGVLGLALVGPFAAMQDAAFRATGCQPVAGAVECATFEQTRAFATGTAAADPYVANTLLNVSLSVGVIALGGGISWMLYNYSQSSVQPAAQRRTTPTPTTQAMVVPSTANGGGMAVVVRGQF